MYPRRKFCKEFNVKLGTPIRVFKDHLEWDNSKLAGNIKVYTDRYLSPNKHILGDNLNEDILNLLEDDKLEIISFNAVTVDGKIIDMRLSK